MDVIYKVKAKVLIDIETEFTTVEGDPKPTADTIKTKKKEMQLAR